MTGNLYEAELLEDYSVAEGDFVTLEGRMKVMLMIQETLSLNFFFHKQRLGKLIQYQSVASN